MDPTENSGRLLKEDLSQLYGLEPDEEKEDTNEGDDECSGSDSQ